MAIRNANPLQFAPHGLTDAFDESDSFPGACRALINLIFDSSNPDQVVARPGVGLPITQFSGFTSPTFVSVHVTIGGVVYGMVSTGRNPGFDEPFVFNTASGTFITVSGVTGANVPTSPATSGAWVPPTITSVGKKVIITHPGFSGAGSNFFGVLDITNPFAPVWSSANTATNPLPGVPTCVANYNNRAYYAVGNVLYASDSPGPTTITNASQQLTVGDPTPIVAQSGLPMQTSTSGIAAALIVFKANQIWQVTGDSALNTLAENFISLTVGTPHPRSVTQTPIGTIFLGQDAPYVLSYTGLLSELKNPNSVASDVRAPFQNAFAPSRTSATYGGNIYRVCLQTILNGVTQTNDYWFDLRRMRWTGPHTFTYDCASQNGQQFILSGVGTGAALFQSIVNDTTQNTLYNDNGTAIASTLVTTSLHDGEAMEFKQTVESSLDVTAGGSATQFNVTAQDDQGVTLAIATVTTPTPSAVWGAFNWGDGTLYNATSTNPRRMDVAWNLPIVWDRMNLVVNCVSSSDVAIGKFKAKWQPCGYSLRAVTMPGVLLPANTPPPSVPPQLDKSFVLNQSQLG